MKKILLLSVLSLIIASCRKKDDSVSTTVTASFPTITFTGTKFFSIPVGGLRPTISASAYDSFYREICQVVTIDSSVNNLVPGLYIARASAKNHFGFVSYSNYYVAVTNVSDSMNLAGHWIQDPTNDSFSTNILKLGRGLYLTGNLNGVNSYTDQADYMSGLFAVTSDTTITFTDNTGILSMVPADTTIYYISAFGPLTFTKQ